MQVGSPLFGFMLFGAPFSQNGGSIQIIFGSHITPCEGSPLFRFHDLKMCVLRLRFYFSVFQSVYIFGFHDTFLFRVFCVYDYFLVFISTLSLLHSYPSLLAVIPHGYLSFVSFLGFRFLKTVPPSSRLVV